MSSAETNRFWNPFEESRRFWQENTETDPFVKRQEQAWSEWRRKGAQRRTAPWEQRI